MVWYDKDFLLKLDKVKNKTVYARITALTFDERPIETIEGRVTQGSINVDGASAVRRTCSLTMIAKDFNYLNYYWGLNTKFKLEIGVYNNIDPQYPNIIWFKQGIYVFTSFNTSRTVNNFTINIQGKDKMCLLNGDLGGSLESQVDFGNIEEENEEHIITITPIPIYDIIRNSVHVYGGEPYSNIIINDIDEYGFELLEYRYDIPMYLYRTAEEGKESYIYTNILMNSNYPCEIDRDGQRITTTLGELLPTELEMLIDPLMGTANPSKIYIEGNPYYVAKIEYGQTAGYRLTPLTYAGDLIGNVGEAITSILDKIKNMLSEFEYFYDLDGRFTFQRKRSFINTIWAPEAESEYIDDDGNSIFYSEKYVQSIANGSSWGYVFNGGELISAFSNNPNLLNLRNDYSVWGVKKGISGKEFPVHLRYAIDIKPEYYTSFDKITYTSKSDDEIDYNLLKTESIISGLDWREIIYQMAKDYYKHNTEDEFEMNLRENNINFYPSGQTGYERYYTDIQGFWRELYNPFILNDREKIENNKKLMEERRDFFYSLLEYWGLVLSAETDLEIEDAKQNYIIAINNSYEILVKYNQVFDEYFNQENHEFIFDYGFNDFNTLAQVEYDLALNNVKAYETNIEQINETIPKYYPEGHKHEYWLKDVFEYPQNLNFCHTPKTRYF